MQGKINVSEIRMKARNGDYRWFRIVGKSEKDNSGKVVSLAGSIADIDEIKKAELASANQVRRRDEFLAMLSHELRNPMSAITYSTDYIESTGRIPSDLQSFFDIITRQTMQMSRLLDDLLDVTRITRNNIEIEKSFHDFRHEIFPLVESMKPMFKERQQELNVDFPDGSLMINGDPARLKQAFANLLDNASKYTATNGKIWFGIKTDGNQLVVTVKDNGCGIRTDVLDEIFDLFYQQHPTHRTAGGMGVGLFLVRHIIEAHGGNVAADSPGVGKGSEFTITLPQANEFIVASSPDETIMFQNLKLALVEDNEDACSGLMHLLEQRGFQVCQFSDGETASLEIPRIRPDVALIDIGLPGKNGYEVAKEIRENGGLDNVLLIALTVTDRMPIECMQMNPDLMITSSNQLE